jgi:hypothetical protein
MVDPVSKVSDIKHEYNANGESRLRALVAKRDWNEIEEIAKNRKSPIGWEVRSHAFSPRIENVLLTKHVFQKAVLQPDIAGRQRPPRSHLHPQVREPRTRCGHHYV